MKEEGQNRADYLVDCGADILTVDIAHGDSDDARNIRICEKEISSC